MNQVIILTLCAFALGAAWAAFLQRFLRTWSRGTPRADDRRPADPSRPAAGQPPAEMDPGAQIAAVCYGGPLDGHRFASDPRAELWLLRWDSPCSAPQTAAYRRACRSDGHGQWIYRHDPAATLQTQ